MIADALAACYDVNLAVWAGAASEVELQAVRWASEFVGLPGRGRLVHERRHGLEPDRAHGRARARASRRAPRSASRAAASPSTARTEVHYSVVRAAELLGIGSNHVRVLPIDDSRRLAARGGGGGDRRGPRIGHRARRGGRDRRDDPHRRRRPDRRARRRLRRARSLAARRRRLRPAGRLRPRARRGSSAGSSAPTRSRSTPTSGSTCRRRAASSSSATAPIYSAALGHEGAYLPHDREEQHAADITLEYSRPFRALKLWLALRVHGAAAFRAAIERNLDQAQLLYRTRRGEPPSSSRCPHAPAALGRPLPARPAGRRPTSTRTTPRSSGALQEGGEFWVAHARIDGRIYIRPCIVNFRTTDDDVLAFVEHVERSAASSRNERRLDGLQLEQRPVGTAGG